MWVLFVVGVWVGILSDVIVDGFVGDLVELLFSFWGFGKDW